MSGPIFIQSQRNLAGIIIPDCIVEEVGRDELEITEHPVEQGASITDHAYKRPREVTLRWSWTNSGRSDTYVKEVYNSLLGLQASLAPFSISTGKSQYTNMLISSLSQTTNNAQENSLAIVALCTEIILVSTSTVTVPPMSAQANPQTTSPVIQTGAAQPVAQPAGFGGGISSTVDFP